MVYVFRVSAPGNDLDGETWDFQSATYAIASQRAYARLADTFALSKAEPHLIFVGEYSSRVAMARAVDRAEESGVALTPADVDTVLAVALADDLSPGLAKAATSDPCKRHDFRDGDLCSKCDAMRRSA